MSEHFLKLDPNNYDTEFDYLLNNGIFSFDEFKSLYQEGKITNEDFEKVKDFYKQMIPRYWTYTARKCYKIGCICSKCDAVPDDIKLKCKMKFAVIKLVKKYGRPTKE